MKRFFFVLACFVVVPILFVKFVLPRITDSGTDVVGQLPEPKVAKIDDPTDPDYIVATLIENENLIREIDPVLAKLSQAALNLELLNEDTVSVFAGKCQLRDIVSTAQGPVAATGLQIVSVETGKLQEFSATETNAGIWKRLMEHFDYFEHLRFYAIRLSDRSMLPDSFTTVVGFEAVGRTIRGTWMAIAAGGELQWQKGPAGGWVISNWDYGVFQITESEERLFEDTTSSCFSPTDREYVQRSPHYELLNRILTGDPGVFKDERQKKYFPHIATDRHPSISIVDIDSDGWDDLYVVEQWRDNMLFRNRGDGTFQEVAGEYNLDIPGEGTSACFADFDNDGDEDLFLGRSLQRSQYRENVDGKFVDRSDEKFPFKLPFLVSSLSAADFNGDGLLDIYISTYGFLGPGLRPADWTREFLDEAEGREVMRRYRAPGHNRYLSAVGPTNLLLENQGDHFKISPFSSQLGLYANSLQATWADYDADGDPDLYVANDFARDYLFRNDREAGFKDVTLEVGDESMMGFGMGAAWGDYDLDGWQDLYVSNMYSKAGLRIVEHFGQLDKRFRRSADGNRLYHNTGKRLQLASANNGPGLNVHKAGWSWGGQFMDFNNDCFPDIYVASGYFTAPEKFATDKDL